MQPLWGRLSASPDVPPANLGLKASGLRATQDWARAESSGQHLMFHGVFTFVKELLSCRRLPNLHGRLTLGFVVCVVVAVEAVTVAAHHSAGKTLAVAGERGIILFHVRSGTIVEP